jgi:hypothetical protein
MSAKKELDFFIQGTNLDRRRRWYEDQFQATGDLEIAVGEASTSYTKFPLFQDVPARIAEMIPDVRLVYSVRHPVERMRSHYMHEALLGEEHLPIETALLTEPKYRDISSYALQVSKYFEYFPRERLHIVQAERLRRDRVTVVREVCEFLGVADVVETAELSLDYHVTNQKRVSPRAVRRIVASKSYRSISPLIPRGLKKAAVAVVDRGVPEERGHLSDGVRTQLEDMMRDDVRALRRFMGPDFDGWGIA